MDSKANGAGARHGQAGLLEAAPPEGVADLAEGCVRFVEKKLGFRLDYTPETLPVLDHYLEQAREEATDKPDTLLLLAQTAGAYFGEVLRRRHASWWRMEGEPLLWRVELESVYLAFSPMLFVREALLRKRSAAPPESAKEDQDRDDEDRDEDDEEEEPAASEAPATADEAAQATQVTEEDPGAAEEGGADEDVSHLILEEQDRLVVSARLAELPPVSEGEYYATSTRLEVIDIAVDAIRGRRIAAGEEENVRLEPDDYEMDD